MKALIAIVVIVAAAYGGWQVYSYWTGFKEKNKNAEVAAAPELSGSQLPGLPETLEGQLDAAQRQGAQGLKQFLSRYGSTISDPRLASIELDYVVLVAREDPGEARRVFAKVKQRTPDSSPVYPRVKQLEKTYE
jgi:hypothetical protein